MNVRPANIADLTAILALLADMHAESPMTLPSPNWGKGTHALTDAIVRGVCFVAESAPFAVEGILACVCSTDWYADEPFLSDLCFYVRPRARASTAALRLLREMKKCADSLGLPLRLGVFYGEDVNRKTAMYERLGFDTVGGTFVYTPKQE